MKSYTATLPNGEMLRYVDKKRWLWLLSVLFPLQPLLGVWLHATCDNPIWILLPFASTYLLTPAIDFVIGVDSDNPPDAVIMDLERDPYYRRLTFAVVPLHFVSMLGALAYAATANMQGWAFIALAALTGITAGLAINAGHELGHKNSKLEKTLAKIVLAIPAYGHFSIDHNRGHHKDVATFHDSSSARMGESIYAFAAREIPGAFGNAWRIEKQRLELRGYRAFSPKNQILQSYSLSALIALLCVAVLGWTALPFLLIHHAVGYWQLTSANYIEHYGLLRLQDDDGKTERCQPHHSWNSNHVFTNLALFNLQRHSDHHIHPLRRYQALKTIDEIPQLPSGYIGMYVLAYLPWLWFQAMDKRLMALPHVGGDLERVNIDPKARPSIFLKWGRDQMQEPTVTNIPGI